MTAVNDEHTPSELATRAQVREILLDLAPVKSTSDRSDLQLEAELGYNSLALLEAIVTMEEELGIILTNDGSVSSIRTVADIEDYVIALTRRSDG
ncbi:MAG: acyl carrier protein [Catenulispora sp.]|nr:acyl carrier protein [Catenulispora sp.]